MHKKRIRISYPIFLLLGVSLLLISIVGVLAYSNYENEKELVENFFLEQGLTLVRVVESGIKTGVVRMRSRETFVETLFEEIANSREVESVSLLDEKGKIIASSKKNLVGSRINHSEKLPKESGVFSEVVTNPENVSNLHIIKRIEIATASPMRGMRGMRRMNSSMEKKVCAYHLLGDKDRYIAISLKMDKYASARKEDTKRAIILIIVLLVIGISSLYFIIILQNYYAVNRRFDKMKTYTHEIIESMPNGLISLDNGGFVVLINRYAEEMLHLNAETAIGRSLATLLQRCDAQTLLKQTPDASEQRIECHLNDDTLLPLSIFSTLLKDEDGHSEGRIILLHDLRPIKALEEKIERTKHLAALGRVTAAIAHEIRNPLSSIKGFAHYFLSKSSPGSDDWKYATVMTKESDRLNRVIQDLLNFSRPSTPILRKTDVLPILNHTLKLIAAEVKEKRIEVTVSLFEEKISAVVDEDMLIQLFLNLFINAIDAMEREGVLALTLFEEEKDVVIRIADNGSGIAQEDIVAIFEPFFTSKQGGTGLGLAIVHRLVESMYGEIAVESELGRGTTFVITLRKSVEGVG